MTIFAKHIVFLLLILFPYNQSFGANGALILYAAAQGSGTKCSIKRRCTLETAQAQVEAIAPNMTEDIVVSLADGIYRLKKTMVITEAGSGHNKHKVIYRGEAAGKVRISGGHQITIFGSRNADIWNVKIPAGLIFRQLYVDDRPAIRSRSFTPGEYLRDLRWNGQDMTVSLGAPLSFEIIPGVTELVVNRHWQQYRLRIKSAILDHDGRTILQFEANDAFVSFNAAGNTIDASAVYYFENARSLLDKVNEWFLDQSTSTLFYKPREKGHRLKLILPVVETLVRIEGTEALPVHDISFENIIFEDTTWTRPSFNGFGQVQAVWIAGIDGPHYMPAGIEVRGNGAHNLCFKHNDFRNMGGVGIAFFNATKNNTITENVFHDLAGGGIVVDALPERRDLAQVGSEGFDVTNNRIFNIGRDYTGSVGIFFGFVANSRIEHNEIHELPYTGISVGWGWTNKENWSKNNVISGNRIYHVMMAHDDGGGIYIMSKQPGTLIEKNFISDINHTKYSGSYPVAGIYLDNGAEGVLIRNNVFHGVGDPIHQNLANDPNHGVFPAKNNSFANNAKNDNSVIQASGPQ